MPKNPTLARIILRATLHEAAAAGRVDQPAVILDQLTPAIEEIETSARQQLAALSAELAEERVAHEAERAEWRAELEVLVKLRERAERDAAAITGHQQPGPLADPHGYYVYYLWSHNGDVMYVGMSTNVLGRLGEHVRERRHGIHRITTVTCPDEGTMRRMEWRAIREHRPPWNIVGVPA